MTEYFVLFDSENTSCPGVHGGKLICILEVFRTFPTRKEYWLKGYKIGYWNIPGVVPIRGGVAEVIAPVVVPGVHSSIPEVVHLTSEQCERALATRQFSGRGESDAISMV
jgi:hypothetical protein